MNRKSAVTLQWLIHGKCVSYVGAQEDPSDLPDRFQGYQGKTNCELFKLKFNSVLSYLEVTNKNLASFSIVCTYGHRILTTFYFGLSSW